MISTAEPDTRSAVVTIRQVAGRTLLWLRPDGWQTKARRNAWASMVADRQRRADRAAADLESRVVAAALGLRAQTH